MDAILAKLAGLLSPEEMKQLQDALAGSAPAMAPEMVDLQKQVEAAKKRADDAEAALKQRDVEAAMTPEQREEAVLKSLPAAQREMVLKQREQIAKLEAAAKARDEAEAERVAKSRADALKIIPGDTTHRAFALRALDSLTAKSASGTSASEVITGMLEAAAKMLREAPQLTPLGSPRVPDDHTPEGQIEAKALAVIAADEKLRAMPVAKAMPIARTRVYDAHPDLYAKTRN